jgi:hypothetical protein
MLQEGAVAVLAVMEVAEEVPMFLSQIKEWEEQHMELHSWFPSLAAPGAEGQAGQPVQAVVAGAGAEGPS